MSLEECRSGSRFHRQRNTNSPNAAGLRADGHSRSTSSRGTSQRGHSKSLGGVVDGWAVPSEAVSFGTRVGSRTWSRVWRGSVLERSLAKAPVPFLCASGAGSEKAPVFSRSGCRSIEIGVDCPVELLVSRSTAERPGSVTQADCVWCAIADCSAARENRTSEPLAKGSRCNPSRFSVRTEAGEWHRDSNVHFVTNREGINRSTGKILANQMQLHSFCPIKLCAHSSCSRARRFILNRGAIEFHDLE